MSDDLEAKARAVWSNMRSVAGYMALQRHAAAKFANQAGGDVAAANATAVADAAESDLIALLAKEIQAVRDQERERCAQIAAEVDEQDCNEGGGGIYGRDCLAEWVFLFQEDPDAP
jgi:hypothetical protein